MYKIIDNFFTESECDDYASIVRSNQSQWQKCRWTDMHILGNSLFRKTTVNENSMDHGDYFQTGYFDTDAIYLLKNKLSQYYNKIEFIPNFSRPGFQIIKLNENKTPSIWHYDDMLTCFPFEKYFKDYIGNFNEYFEKKLIFTILISDGNYSFDYYPETASQFGKNYNESRTISPVCKQHRNLVGDNCSNSECKLKEFKTLFYKKGTLLIQERRFLHRVGFKDLDNSSNLRISLQGYGLMRNGILYLVW